jgi:hypothetical protein
LLNLSEGEGESKCELPASVISSALRCTAETVIIRRDNSQSWRTRYALSDEPSLSAIR